MHPSFRDLLLFVGGEIIGPVQGVTSRAEGNQTIQGSLLKSSRSPSRAKGFLAADLEEARI